MIQLIVNNLRVFMRMRMIVMMCMMMEVRKVRTIVIIVMMRLIEMMRIIWVMVTMWILILIWMPWTLILRMKVKLLAHSSCGISTYCQVFLLVFCQLYTGKQVWQPYINTS